LSRKTCCQWAKRRESGTFADRGADRSAYAGTTDERGIDRSDPVGSSADRSDDRGDPAGSISDSTADSGNPVGTGAEDVRYSQRNSITLSRNTTSPDIW